MYSNLMPPPDLWWLFCFVDSISGFVSVRFEAVILLNWGCLISTWPYRQVGSNRCTNRLRRGGEEREQPERPGGAWTPSNEAVRSASNSVGDWRRTDPDSTTPPYSRHMALVSQAGLHSPRIPFQREGQHVCGRRIMYLRKQCRFVTRKTERGLTLFLWTKFVLKPALQCTLAGPHNFKWLVED